MDFTLNNIILICVLIKCTIILSSLMSLWIEYVTKHGTSKEYLNIVCIPSCLIDGNTLKEILIKLALYMYLP